LAALSDKGPVEAPSESGFVRRESLRALAGQAIELAEAGRLEESLRLIHDCVERIITEPLCAARVLASAALDRACQEVGRRQLALIDRPRSPPPTTDRPLYIYIVTRLQRSGGHTRVMEDFIRARPEALHLILSTELSGRSDLAYLRSGVLNNPSVGFEPASRWGGFRGRLQWLQTRLLEERPRKIYLFNHHQDSVAVAAVQGEMGIDTAFYHHGDHHLCLGVHLPGVEHIDPHPMGYRACSHELGVKNAYVPLVLDDKGARSAQMPFMPEGSLTTCTAAQSNKVEIPYFVSYTDTVPELLHATGGRHVHIGRLSWAARARIRRGMKRLGVSSERFTYIPWVPSVWQALKEQGVDLYIASFPYGGGLTLIEAMGAGVPVALHRHIYSRVLSGIDLAYEGAFIWREPAELLRYCATRSPAQLSDDSRRARARYELFHRPEILVLCLNQAAPMEPPAAAEFDPWEDEWAFWAERQISLRHLFGRAAYRLFRYLRRRF
jgi:hypothetical protein